MRLFIKGKYYEISYAVKDHTSMPIEFAINEGGHDTSSPTNVEEYSEKLFMKLQQVLLNRMVMYPEFINYTAITEVDVAKRIAKCKTPFACVLVVTPRGEACVQVYDTLALNVVQHTQGALTDRNEGAQITIPCCPDLLGLLNAKSCIIRLNLKDSTGGVHDIDAADIHVDSAGLHLGRMHHDQSRSYRLGDAAKIPTISSAIAVINGNTITITLNTPQTLLTPHSLEDGTYLGLMTPEVLTVKDGVSTLTRKTEGETITIIGYKFDHFKSLWFRG